MLVSKLADIFHPSLGTSKRSRDLNAAGITCCLLFVKGRHWHPKCYNFHRTDKEAHAN